MQKSNSLFPAEVLMWSLLAQCERQIFDHEMTPPHTAGFSDSKGEPPRTEPDQRHP